MATTVHYTKSPVSGMRDDMTRYVPPANFYLMSPDGNVHRHYGTTCVIGRSRRSDRFVYNAIVSRRHAVIEQRGGICTVMDCGSENGTYLNGKQLPPYQRVLLTHGDMLMLGSSIKTVAVRFRVLFSFGR